MADEMLNSSKPYNKSTGVQGIGDTVEMMKEYDMNALNDPIAENSSQRGRTKPSRYSKNS